MSDSRRPNRDDAALPQDDAPADSDSFPGHEEPDPAEVVGDEDHLRDLSQPRPIDPEHRDTLDERLREELPENSGRGGAGSQPSPGALLDDLDPDQLGAEDESDPDAPDQLSAEEDAIHRVR